MLKIHYAGMEILGRPRDMTRPYGLFVIKDGLQGWGGLSAGRREALARAVQHGEHDAPVYLPARVMTIDGVALAPSEYELGELCDRVTGAGATGGLLDVTVDYRGKSLAARGRQILAEIDEKQPLRKNIHRAAFQLQLVFADPRKYGRANSLPGDRLIPVDPDATATTFPVFHYGNFPGFPVFEIPAAPTSYTISAAGKTFTVTGATAGGLHRVELRSGRVFRNGVEMPGVGRGDLWAIAPGSTLPHVLSAPGRVKIRDTHV